MSSLVVALLVLGGGVVKGEKMLDEILVSALGVVKTQVNNLNVTCGSRTNMAVRWILDGILVGAHEAN